jgi:hypothetical protein
MLDRLLPLDRLGQNIVVSRAHPGQAQLGHHLQNSVAIHQETPVARSAS